MKKNEIKTTVSKALEEVWEWKDKAYNETKDKTFEELKILYWKSLKKAASVLNSKLTLNPDGTYSFE